MPVPSGAIGTALIGGWTTWWDTCPQCAAAGPLLREALGPRWQGQWITVESRRGSVELRLVTSCACGDRQGIPTILDVSVEAFNVLSPYPARSDRDPGYVRISIEIDPPADPRDDAMRIEDGGPRPTLPPTDR